MNHITISTPGTYPPRIKSLSSASSVIAYLSLIFSKVWSSFIYTSHYSTHCPSFLNFWYRVVYGSIKIISEESFEYPDSSDANFIKKSYLSVQYFTHIFTYFQLYRSFFKLIVVLTFLSSVFPSPGWCGSMYIYFFREILKIFYTLPKISLTTLKSVFEIPLEILLGFLFELSSMLFETFCLGFSSWYSSRPSHESRDRRSRTGVADAKKFHRELTRPREEQDVREEQGQKISDAETGNTMPP